MVISLILLILPSVSALSFEFSSPNSLEIYNNFSISISASVSEDYDVKIFVQDNETKITISEIYNEGWKNPYYYIKSAFPSRTSFIARVTNLSDNAVLCVRLRKTGGSSYSEECKSLDISGSYPEPQEETAESADSLNSANLSGSSDSLGSSGSEPPEEVLSASNMNKISEDFIPLKQEATSVQQTASQEETIRLNSPKPNEVFVTSEEKVRLYAVYAFTFLVTLIVIFLIFKKL